MHYRFLLDGLFGEAFVDDELVPRIVATTYNDQAEAERKLDNCLVYLFARGQMADPNSPLVCNLGPDEAWHVFILYTDEYARFCEHYFGVFLHHDPAGEAALVNSPLDTSTTLAWFRKLNLRFDPDLWMDHVTYPNGAIVVPSRVVRASRF